MGAFVMLDAEERDSLNRAEQIYEERLRLDLERSHMHDYVVIEPLSGDHFVGRTLGEASALARVAHPGRLKHTMRVGHTAAYHMGSSS
jgi:hypothetical protein